MITSSMYARSREFYHMEQTFVVAGYVRNSDPSKKDTEILNAQKEALRAYAKREYGVDIPDHLMYEDAVSAIKFPYWERQGLMRAWDEAENKRFDKLLVTEYFRIARKSSEQYAVMEYFKRFGVEVVSITEKFEDSAEGRLLHAVQGFLGEIEAEKTRIRTARGKRHRQGLVLTGQGTRTYGLKFVNTKEYTNAYYIPNTEVIAVIEGVEWTELDVLAFEREKVLQGWSTNSIAITLTKMGIPTQTGRQVWNRRTILQHLTNGNYRGYPYAVNNRWTKEGAPYSRRRTDESEHILLPEGIYPRIIDPEEFEAIQVKLEQNKELAARNNHMPNETLMRGLLTCGICGNRMHVGRHKKAYGGHFVAQRSEYQCKRNEGVDELKRHHCVTIAVHLLDKAAWEFALLFILNPMQVRDSIEALKEQIKPNKRVETLEKALQEIREKIVNLISVAQGASDELTRTLYRENLAALEKDRRDTENLLNRFSSKEEQEEKLRKALDKFEVWAMSQQQCILDPDYQITQEDKRAAMLILGVKATVWPAEGYEDRVQFTLSPPDISRSYDGDIVKAIQYAAEKMQTTEAMPVSAGQGGE